ncbi:N(G),N(G)-dimethylarginine dimethylaminohydrolase [bacterium]|nr:N(G),N(G)-dimethylarginine dimethylaminohydrolase [bacterium]
MAQGITSANLGVPVFDLAKVQHDAYIKTLKTCGLEVIVLEADESHPDSVFVEDTAVVTESVAVITNPYPDSRKGETIAIKSKLEKIFGSMAVINEPGTFEGGDVMQVDRGFYVGVSGRTNKEGIDQFTAIQKKYNYWVTSIEMKELLHLKTGISYLGNNTMIMVNEFTSEPLFDSFKRIVVEKQEEYAANCIRVNEFVLVPLGFPKTVEAIKASGFRVKELDMSEFRKLDGGLSCLSLRF